MAGVIQCKRHSIPPCSNLVSLGDEYCMKHCCPICHQEKSSMAATCEIHAVPQQLCHSLLARAKAGRWLEVEEILQYNRGAANCQGAVYSLLHRAVLSQNSYAVAMVLSHGANPNLPTLTHDPTLNIPQGSTALHIAAARGYSSLLALLLCSGASEDVLDGNGHTPLEVATDQRCRLVLQDDYLMERATALCQAASAQQFPQVLHLISTSNVPLDIKDSPHSDCYLIHHVAAGANMQVYNALLAKGACPLLRTRQHGLLPSAIARTRGAEEVAKMMEAKEHEAWAYLSSSSPTVVTSPVSPVAPTRSPPKASSSAGKLLALAKSGMWLEVANKLLKRRGDANSQGAVYALLHRAVLSHSSYAVAMLLHYGADADIQTMAHDSSLNIPQGSTPLHIAAMKGYASIVSLLLCSGANKEVCDAAGHPPLEVAANKRCRAVLQDHHLLERAMALCTAAKDQQFDKLLSMITKYDLPLNIKRFPSSDFYIIHQAAFWGNLEAYNALVARGASPLMRTREQNLLPSAVAREMGAEAAALEMERKEEEARHHLALSPKAQHGSEGHLVIPTSTPEVQSPLASSWTKSFDEVPEEFTPSQRMQVQCGPFRDFRPERFDFCGIPPPQPLLSWLVHLPTADHLHRFSPQHISKLITLWESKVEDLRQGIRPEDVVQQVEQNKQRHGHLLSQKVRHDIMQTAIPTISEEDILALVTYTAHLYDENTNPQVAHTYQIYKSFNAVCREYGHADVKTHELMIEWELFLPLAFHLDAAIRALPKIPMVLYRGIGQDIEVHRYPLGEKGSWGGCISASADRMEAIGFVHEDDALKAKNGCYFLIISDEARPIYFISPFPEELEFLHPLAQEFEVCSWLPVSLLQMLSFNINIVILKLAGRRLPLSLHFDALDGLAFIYDDFLASYVPPLVKDHPHSRDAAPLQGHIEAFLTSQSTILTIAAEPGMGKTTCALWLAKETRWLGRVWLFISLPSVSSPFAHNGLAAHLQKMLGLDETVLEELQATPLVLILDSLDEVPIPSYKSAATWWDLNSFHKWNLKLIVTCRRDSLKDYMWCLGTCQQLYIKEFSVEHIESYVYNRLKVHRRQREVAQRWHWGEDPSLRTLATQVAQVMDEIRKSPITASFCSPFRLSMGLDLALAGPQPDHTPFRYLERPSDLYQRWLEYFVWHKEGNAEDVLRAEELAWDMHRQRLVQTTVGNRTGEAWFRRCPLRIHNFDSTSVFSFRHKSIQEFLVARFVLRKLQQDTPWDGLSIIDFTDDYPVLWFFGDLCSGMQDEAVSKVYNKLWSTVMSSREDPEQGRSAANAISLLNAARVSFSGRDLSDVRIPKAALQCAELYNANLQGAYLVGADLQGAVLDFANLSNANLQRVKASPLLAVMQGHESDVSSVAISTDGKVVASGSDDHTVRLWDGATGTVLHILHGHTGCVTGVAVSPIGDLVVSAATDNKVIIWSMVDGKTLVVLRGHTGSVRGVAISPTGRLVASASKDCTVRLWDPHKGLQLATFQGHFATVNSVAISSDSGLVVSGSDDGRVVIWDVPTGQLRSSLAPCAELSSVLSVNISSDDQLIVAGSADSCVRIWSVATECLIKILTAHQGKVNSVVLSYDNRIIVSGSDDKTVRTWNTSTGQLLSTLQAHTSSVRSVAIDASNKIIVSASDDGVRTWNATVDQLLNKMEGHLAGVLSVAVSTDGRTVASGCADGSVGIWDATTGQLIKSLRDHDGAALRVVLPSKSDVVVCGTSEAVVSIWDISSGEHIKSLDSERGAVGGLAVTSDGEWIVAGYYDGSIVVWDAPSGDTLHVLEGHGSYVNSVALTADGTTIASGGGDKTVRVWDAIAGQPLRVMVGHTSGVNDVAISRDGTLVASASDDKTVCLWDPATGTVRQVLRGHLYIVECVAITSEGDVVVSGSHDKTIRLWDTYSGAPIACLEGHAHFVQDVAVSADGCTVVSGSFDMTIRVWMSSAGQMIGSRRKYAEGSPIRPSSRGPLSDSTRRPMSIEPAGGNPKWTSVPSRAYTCRVLREASQSRMPLFTTGIVVSASTVLDPVCRFMFEECDQKRLQTPPQQPLFMNITAQSGVSMVCHPNNSASATDVSAMVSLTGRPRYGP